MYDGTLSRKALMKKSLLLVALLGSTLAATHGADPQQADVLKQIPEVPLDRVERYIYFQTSTLNKAFGIGVNYTGVIPQLMKADNPLQLINPFAPARYGNAYDNVSINPLTGRPEGIAIFAIRF
jgi:hypothetical protein